MYCLSISSPTYHQCTGVKTLLVIFALKVLSSKLEDLAIVEPEKADDDDVKNPSDNDLGPNCWSPDTERSNVENPVLALFSLVFLPSGHVDGQENSNTSDTQGEEHVATHANEAKEDGSIHTDQRHKLLLLGLP